MSPETYTRAAVAATAADACFRLRAARFAPGDFVRISRYCEPSRTVGDIPAQARTGPKLSICVRETIGDTARTNDSRPRGGYPIRFDSLDSTRATRSFVFSNPLGEVTAWSLDEVLPALHRLASEVEHGAYAAGFISYEAAPAFDSALAVQTPNPRIPLLFFGLYGVRQEVEPPGERPPIDADYVLGPPGATLTKPAYTYNVRRILDLIAAGDTYQVNLTFRLRGTFRGSPEALYADLVQAQRAAFCAYIPVGRHLLLSASPELFFCLSDRRLELRPMKGTRPRGRWAREDEALAEELATSPKEQAENLMIVDLLRNDMGRLTEFGSVRVPAMFEVERYPTVLQLTSSITGTLRNGVGIAEMLGALFPSGSVTGAPKIRTSQIIEKLEDSPRGPYTGAIGFFGPDEAVFSVAIRTLVLDLDAGRYELGVGSGITADSNPAAEYEECLKKGAFLHHRLPAFDLLESLRLDAPGGYWLIEDHLERLSRSATYFEIPLNIEHVREILREEATRLQPGHYKVRLLVDPEGIARAESEPNMIREEPLRLTLARHPVDERNPLLFHKTTHREVYRRALEGCAGADDVMLYNRRGELTESTTANLVLRIGGRLLTPPMESGLLPGILRGKLLEDGTIEERVLTPSDLLRAEEIHLVNSVRGWRRAVLEEARSADPSGHDAPKL
ncbi:MAG: aminodeoxychorismate synthase component I [Gemmatimonas sp.]|nr:aminodeoxychorismate synthase component I [Gemmatimonas sp.]